MHSVRRPRAFAVVRQTDSGKTLSDVSVVEGMALSPAVAGPNPIAGRKRGEASRAKGGSEKLATAHERAPDQWLIGTG
jgi:hypothetical protein